ncbi:MAG TPA: ABC transporter permease [Acidobacteriota bacterium]|nr:ABC transporter permease [Acidobacteriota bacterium]
MKFSISRRLYRALLSLFGGQVGQRHGGDMEALFLSMLRRESSRRGVLGWLHVWTGALADLMGRAPAKSARFQRPSRESSDLAGPSGDGEGSSLLPGRSFSALSHRQGAAQSTQAKGATMASFKQDLQFGWRVLAKNPGFALVAVLTLALGIGANTAIFSVVNATLLSSLPFPQAERLVMGWVAVPKLGLDPVGFSPPDYQLLEEQQDVFEDLGAVLVGAYELSGGSEAPQRVVAFRATSGYFRALGVQPLHGRWLMPQDDEPGGQVAVLSGRLWRQRFEADPSIVGQSVLLDRVPFEVVGVMPDDFQLALPGLGEGNADSDLWVPRGFTAAELQGYGQNFAHIVVARLKPGIGPEELQAQADVLASRAQEAYPAAMQQMLGNEQTLFFKFVPLYEQLVGGIRTPLIVLQIAVLLVLLIGCANIANLLLVRAASRGRELALRSALGAGRGRLLRQMLSEGLLLGLLGGLAGLAVALAALPLLRRLIPQGLPQTESISINLTVLAFTFLLSMGTAVLFTLIPAWKATRNDIQQALREGGRQGSGGASNRLQGAFVVAQMTLAMVLLVGAGLLLRSFEALTSTDPGFQPSRVITTKVELPLVAYSQAQQIRNFYDDLLLRLQGLPSVQAVGASTDLPLNITERRGFLRQDEEPSADSMRSVVYSWMKGDYLEAMGIRLLRGRAFNEQDRAGSQPVTLISESVADQYFPDKDPLGMQVSMGGGPPLYTIVGVVGDVKDQAMHMPALPHAYVPYAQEPDTTLLHPRWKALRGLNLAVRTNGDPEALLPLIRSQLREIDPQLALTAIRTMDADVAKAVSPQRFNTLLLSIFAGTALFLAAVGIYGVISYSVNQRRQEMGIRMALGGQKADLLKLVLGQGTRLIVLSLLLGAAAALALSHTISGLLYGVGARDPLTFVAVPMVLAVIALLACLIPARRAAKVDPMRALRAE